MKICFAIAILAALAFLVIIPVIHNIFAFIPAFVALMFIAGTYAFCWFLCYIPIQIQNRDRIRRFETAKISLDEPEFESNFMILNGEVSNGTEGLSVLGFQFEDALPHPKLLVDESHSGRRIVASPEAKFSAREHLADDKIAYVGFCLYSDIRSYRGLFLQHEITKPWQGPWAMKAVSRPVPRDPAQKVHKKKTPMEIAEEVVPDILYNSDGRVESMKLLRERIDKDKTNTLESKLSPEEKEVELARLDEVFEDAKIQISTHFES